MPELPEVETVRRGLEGVAVDAEVTDVKVFDQRSIRRNVGTIETFTEELIGSKLSAFARRGKFLWIPLSNSRCLVAHLGMSGQIIVRQPEFPIDKFERVKISLMKLGKYFEMRFIDQRLFGGLHLTFLSRSSAGLSLPATATHIAADPLDSTFDAQDAVTKILRSRASIKSLLLNQAIISGIGNIYADEILWEAQLHYRTRGVDLSPQKLEEVFSIAREIFIQAVAKGGTSFDAQYKNVNGESGNFSQSLKAYGQTGLPCKRCGNRIIREPWSNRGSHFCPFCQKIDRK